MPKWDGCPDMTLPALMESQAPRSLSHQKKKLSVQVAGDDGRNAPVNRTGTLGKERSAATGSFGLELSPRGGCGPPVILDCAVEEKSAFRYWGWQQWVWKQSRERASNSSISKVSAMCGSPRTCCWFLVGEWPSAHDHEDDSTRWPQRSRDASVRAPTQKLCAPARAGVARVVCEHHEHSKMAHSAKSRFMQGDVTATQSFFFQVKVFHDLNASSV